MQNKRLTSSLKQPVAIAIAIALFTLAGACLAQPQTEPADVIGQALIAEPGSAPEAAPAPATTLERIGAAGVIRLGYHVEARPYSWRDEAGQPAGYAVGLCNQVAGQVKTRLGLTGLTVEWVPLSRGSISDVSGGKVDVLCGAAETLTGRKEVSFSIPIFPGGIGALLRVDAPARLKLALEGKPLPNQPLWRGTPVQVLQHRTFSAVSGSISEAWLKDKIDTFKILATVSPVESFAAGVEKVANRSSDVMFGDRDMLLDAAKRSSSSGDLVVLDRLFTLGPVTLALPRGDEDFRLLVDQTLSQFYSSDEFIPLYVDHFGEPRENILLYYRIITIPE